MVTARHVMRCAQCIVAGVCAAFLALPAAQAQTYPTKPIRIILPFAGGSDTVGRLVATSLSASLGQQVVPDPRVGALGARGTVFAGQFDPVRVLPSTATPVLRVDTLILGNGCASRTAISKGVK